MDTTAREVDGRRRRRTHSLEFKAEAIAACCQAGVSIASVALSRGLNANLLRRWVIEAERDGRRARVVAPAPGGDLTPAQPALAFVPLSLAPPVPAAAGAPADICIELRRGETTVTVTWPSGAAAECASWMRELLR